MTVARPSVNWATPWVIGGTLSCLGEYFRFLLGDAAVAICVALPDGGIERPILAAHDAFLMVEHDRDGDSGGAFGLAAMGGGFAKRFIEDAPGGLVLELDLRAGFVAIDGLLMRDAARQHEGEQAGNSELRNAVMIHRQVRLLG